MIANRRNNLRGKRRGMTLIEAVAAVVILTIAVPPVLITIFDSHQSRANPILALRARWMAEEKLEDIIADRHALSRGYGYLVPANYPDEVSVPGFPGFSRRVIFHETGADLQTPGEGFMRVRIEVSWTDAQQQARTLGIETVLTEYDAP